MLIVNLIEHIMYYGLFGCYLKVIPVTDKFENILLTWDGYKVVFKYISI